MEALRGWRMPQLVAGCAACLVLAAGGAWADARAVEAMLDVDLGFDDVSDFETTADVYCSRVVSDPCEV